MATSTFTLVANNSTDALFRAWALALHDAIIAVGLVTVAQTGDINFATVVKPPASNTFQGSRIYRFNDTLQATNPVFIKIEYGSAASAQAQAAIRVTVGNGVDGSGNFLSGAGFGSTTAKILWLNNATPPSAASYVSGDTNRLQFILWPLGIGASQSAPFFSIERQKSSAGADIADGVLIAMTGGTTNNGVQVIFTKEGAVLDSANGTGNFFGAIRPSGATALFGFKIGAFPLHYVKGSLLPPPMGVLFYYAADMPITTWPMTVSLTIYGALHTYLVCGATLYQLLGSANNFVHSFLMRYE